MHSQKADFSLPGENNPFHGTDGDIQVSSSIATAGSAGCFTYLYNLIVIVIVCLVNPNTTDRPTAISTRGPKCTKHLQRCRCRCRTGVIYKQFPRVQNFSSHRLKDYVLQHPQEYSEQAVAPMLIDQLE